MYTKKSIINYVIKNCDWPMGLMLNLAGVALHMYRITPFFVPTFTQQFIKAGGKVTLPN